MTTYTLTRTLKDWDRHGRACNIRHSVVLTTDDPVLAGKTWVTHGLQWAPKDSPSMSVQNETGAEVEMVDLYAAVVGAETYAAQLADESFSINLDHFFRDYA